MRRLVCISVLLVQLFLLKAQDRMEDSSGYNPLNFFAPAFNPIAGNAFRSAGGVAGPMYWQNTSSYLIHATLSEKDTSISGDVTISYINNSPDKLDYLWLQLDQNLFDSSSRGAASIPYAGDRFGVSGFKRGGYKIGRVSISYGGKTYNAQPLISDTRMQIRLKNPLLPKGDKISITISYGFAIPAHGADRMGRLYTEEGVEYEIAQWYPRMCVYDDVEGWNTLPYMGLGEFYCDYGNFDYYITAPAEMIVYGSGDLQNAQQVLTSEQIKRLAAASLSDKTVSIISADEIGKSNIRPSLKGNLTWHFTMRNSRDVAWVASKALVWDAAKVNLPSGRKILAMSAYPVESVGHNGYSRGTEYLKSSIEFYSKEYYEYPWNTAVNIGGAVTGMEYPGIIFNSYKSAKSDLWFVISHEIGHNWYPMIVGSNERKYMWQDEGLNTFINYYDALHFNHGEYANDPHLIQNNLFTILQPATFLNCTTPLMLVPEAMGNEYNQYYGKTVYGLQLLRNQILGADRFDYAFRKYTAAWAFKHPTPYDFFRCMNSAGGEDLNWFWKEWFFTTWKLDQAIVDVKYDQDDPAKGALITIENKGKMILPVILEVVQSNGKSETIKLPVEIWQRGGTWTLHYNSSGKIQKVVLDPEQVLPDIDRDNNVWELKGFNR
jgi:hypothetical protein